MAFHLSAALVTTLRTRVAAAALLLLVAILVPACGAERSKLPPGTLEPDKLLHERGNEALNRKRWLTAREYFRQLYDGYPQSPFRADAKLGLADTYLGENTAQASVQAMNEFQEFLTYYPTHPRADYAQFKLAMAHYYQMPKPERDQTETKAAIKEFEHFFERFPSSALTDEARTRYREARDRLGLSEYQVGLFYYRSRWYPGAIDRFKALLKNDPQFTHRDAVYYYLAESLLKSKQNAEALPYYELLISQFEQSDYLDEAQKRVAELKASLAADSKPSA